MGGRERWKEGGRDGDAESVVKSPLFPLRQTLRLPNSMQYRSKNLRGRFGVGGSFLDLNKAEGDTVVLWRIFPLALMPEEMAGWRWDGLGMEGG